MDSSPELPPPPIPAAASGGPCWSAILQTPAPAPSQPPIPSRVFGPCKSTKGISVAVVDANAIIHGDKLVGAADKFVTLKEVLDEVRDPVSRRRMAFLPLTVETMEPSPESIRKVVKFARETGDLQTLSDVDLKLIALAYMLEGQIHGTGHLRDSPPPLRVVNVRKLEEAVMPGWGKNVPNLAEWEALDQVTDGGLDRGSRVLPLKDLDDNIIPKSSSDGTPGEQDSENQSFVRPRGFSYPKKEIKIDGKKMVSAGIDASHGEDFENAAEWKPAVSRSTHRRFLRRQARREMSEASEKGGMPSEEGSMGPAVTDGDVPSDSNSDSEAHPENELPENKRTMMGNPRVVETDNAPENADLDVSEPMQEHTSPEDVGSDHQLNEEGSLDDIDLDMEGDEIGVCTNELQELEISSCSGSFLAFSYLIDLCYEVPLSIIYGL